jgi:8-oxo-dGTP pyrophosphatase MutT (NUDIX family)
MQNMQNAKTEAPDRRVMNRTEELLAMLRAFRTDDPAEAADVERTIALLEAGDEAFTRRHFDPGHVTASVFIIHLPNAQILLHHHRRLGKWLQMGGHVDPGEPIRETALREGREESGLTDLMLIHDEPFDVNIHPIPAGKGEPPHRHFDIRFIATTESPESATFDAAESRELGWFSLRDGAEKMNEPESRRAIAKMVRLLSKQS